MALKVHHLRPAPGAKSRKIRVGRGEAGRRGKTAGRGTKGSGARHNVPENFEGGQMPLHMRLPKRGFNNPFAKDYAEVNLGHVQKLLYAGKLDAKAVIDQAALQAAGVARGGKNGVRLLGKGELTTKVSFKVAGASKGAIAAVEKAGGSVEVIVARDPAALAAAKKGSAKAAKKA